MRPRSSTMMRSARSTVDSRCAMTMVVRPRISVSSAACTWRSDSESSAEVASSRMSTGASLSSARSEEHTSELQSHSDLVCRLLLEKKKKTNTDDEQENAPGKPSHHNN